MRGASALEPPDGGRQLLCLLPSLHDTLIARRIAMLTRSGFAVEAAAFARPVGFGRAPGCPVVRLGALPPRQYLRRLPTLLRAAGQVRALIRRHALVYAFGPDLAWLATLAGAGLARPLVVEVADIKAIQVERSWRGRVVRALDKRVLSRSGLLVLTAAGYETYYREEVGVATPTLIIENKLDPAFTASLPPPAPPGRGQAQARPWRIGWFGRLRDAWTLRVLDEVTRQAPGQFTAVLAGTVSPFLREFSARVAANPHLAYRGGYRYPDDLPALYGGIDLTMACHTPRRPDHWSRGNRYYEACLFRKPVLIRAGQAPAHEIRRHGIGLIIEAGGVREAVATLRGIRAADMAHWQENLAALPPSVYTTTTEGAALRAALVRLVEAWSPPPPPPPPAATCPPG